MFVASLEATSGSVMPKHERISPSSSGCSQRSCCSGVPNFARTSMFPVSGAAQLIASGAISMLRPLISAIGAYSRFVSPAPWVSSGRKRFHRPSARARRLEVLDDLRDDVRVALAALAGVDGLRGVHVLVHEARHLLLQCERALGVREVHGVRPPGRSGGPRGRYRPPPGSGRPAAAARYGSPP